MKVRHAIVAIAGLTACSAAGPASNEPRYTATATVLEDASHGPELCLGAVLTSLPPQCGGPPVSNWDWDAAAGSDTRGDTTWGTYTVVGTYDGDTFTLVEPAVAADRSAASDPPEDTIITPCDPPDGGWRVVDPAKISDDAYAAAIRDARREPDFAGAWLDRDGGSSGDPSDDRVLNLAFTGALEQHEAEARRHWGGPLCVTRHDHTEHELRALTDPAREFAEELGMDVLFSSHDPVRGRVEIGVDVVWDGAQQRFDERFGAGVVVLDGALEPLGD